MVDEDILIILEKRERKKFFSNMQAQAEKEGHIPRMPFFFLRRMAWHLQYAGGILLGIFLGIFILIFNFILFNYLLHIQF